MKPIVQFLQNELPQLNQRQQASLREMLLDVYKDDLTEELESSFNLDNEKEEAQFVAGEHRNQNLIMERIISILSGDTMRPLHIETVPELLAAHCKSFEGTAKLFANPELEELPEDRLKEIVGGKIDELLALFPGITTREELEALMRAQKQEKKLNFEAMMERFCVEVRPKKNN